MTIRDLVEKLYYMPPDAIVVIDMMSEYQALDTDQPRMEKMIERNGTYMYFNEKHWDYEKDGQPVLLDVCHFPGN